MTTLAGRPRSGVLVIDMQNRVVADAYECDSVVANIGRLTQAARRSGVPVIWVQHESAQLVKGEDGWRIVPQLVPAAGEPIIAKLYGDAFEDTDLESLLAALGVGRLFVTGAQTDACVRSTLHGAFARGYDVTLVKDAHTTSDLSSWGAPPPGQVIAHTNLYWTHQRAPGRTAATVAAAEVEFAI
jgi:nicotinamidase-related amidase